MQGKNDSESGAKAGLGLILKRAVMFFNNARRDGQAQAGAEILGREKRDRTIAFQLPAEFLCRCPLTSKITTVISRLSSHFSSRRARKVTVPFSPMLSAAFWIKLIKTCLICCGSTRICACTISSSTSLIFDFSRSEFHQFLNFAQRFFCGNHGELRFRRARKLQKIFNDALKPVDFAADEFGVGKFRRATA